MIKTLEEMNLSVRTYSVLHQNGFNNSDDILEYLKKNKSLEQLNGFGPRQKDEVEQILAGLCDTANVEALLG